MKTQKKLAAKLLFTKQTVARLNEDSMASMRGGAAFPGGEGFNIFGFTEPATSQCGSTGDFTCNTLTANPITITALCDHPMLTGTHQPITNHGGRLVDAF